MVRRHGLEIDVPIQLVACDEATAQAISRQRAKGGTLIIQGRFYLDRPEDARRDPLRLRVVAEHVVLAEDPVIATAAEA